MLRRVTIIASQTVTQSALFNVYRQRSPRALLDETVARTLHSVDQAAEPFVEEALDKVSERSMCFITARENNRTQSIAVTTTCTGLRHRRVDHHLSNCRNCLWLRSASSTCATASFAHHWLCYGSGALLRASESIASPSRMLLLRLIKYDACLHCRSEQSHYWCYIDLQRRQIQISFASTTFPLRHTCCKHPPQTHQARGPGVCM